MYGKDPRESYAQLETLGLWEDTLLVVTSDHGERLGEGGRLGHLMAMDPHLLRVPLFVRHPERVAPGRVTERVQLTGLPGFLLETAGIEAPEIMASRSLSRRAGEPAVAQHRSWDWYVERIHRQDPDFDASPHLGDRVLVADDEYALLHSPERGAGAAQLAELGSSARQEASEAQAAARRDRAALERLEARMSAGPRCIDPSAGEPGTSSRFAPKNSFLHHVKRCSLQEEAK